MKERKKVVRLTLPDSRVTIKLQYRDCGIVERMEKQINDTEQRTQK